MLWLKMNWPRMCWKMLAVVNDCVIVQKVNFRGLTHGEKEVCMEQKGDIFQMILLWLNMRLRFVIVQKFQGDTHEVRRNGRGGLDFSDRPQH